MEATILTDTVWIENLQHVDTIISILPAKENLSFKDSFFSNPLASIAFVISCVALLFSIFWSFLSHRHNLTSVKPICHLFFKYTEESGEFIYTLTNGGVGPALISDIKYIYKDKVHSNLREVLKEFNKEFKVNDLVTKMNMRNVTLSVNDPTNLMSGILIKTKMKGNSEPFCDELSKITVEVIYRSVYKKKFTLKENIDSPFCKS